ncbi:MAG: hypothetical protein ABSA45_04415 [Verrucomicrobiota bacterium]|jgi:hypothetical protein
METALTYTLQRVRWQFFAASTFKSAKLPERVRVAAWAARALPARLDVTATAKLLGFTGHDIQVLMAVGKLTPLGDPAPNAPKWFSAAEVIRLAADKEWLHKATRELSKHWRHKRERRMNPVPAVVAAN